MSLRVIKNSSEQGVIDRALEIAEKRRNTLLRLKEAIRAQNLAEADKLITELVPDVKEINRAHKSLHSVPSR